jgi:ABC-type branched-subunit amino acid transport system substrate-binding protein
MVPPSVGTEFEIAVAVSLTGPGKTAGDPVLNGARLAVEEANADGDGVPVELVTYDDKSSPDGARDAAQHAVADNAVAVVGPAISVLSLAAGPIYAQNGLVSITPTAHSDRVTVNRTTFRPVFSTSEMGRWLVVYVRHVLGLRKVVVLYKDDGFGQPMRDGVIAAGKWLGVEATVKPVTTQADREATAAERANDADNTPIILGMIDSDAAPLLVALRRAGVGAPILAPSALAEDAFAATFSAEPESEQNPGFFTDGIYAVAPAMIDSANAETLAVSARYRARFGKDLNWEVVQGYDSMRLAISAARAADAKVGAAGAIAARRQAVRDFLVGLNSPETAVQSLTGPLWFTPERGRRQAVRVGRFHGSLFDSAPVQLVPVESTSAAERASHAVLEIAPGQFAKRQQVAYAGIYLNEISRIDMAPSTFTADFYLWLRFSLGAPTAGAADPTEIDFPDMVRGSFDAKRPASAGDLDDGTTYRLWRIRGDFKNDFDLHRYPFDAQKLVARLFNARAASDQIVYVQDRRSIRGSNVDFQTAHLAAPSAIASSHAEPNPSASPSHGEANESVSPDAFRNLTQWDPARVNERRDILVTDSALGDPRLVGVARMRELSGYRIEVEVLRRTVSTLTKTLLPLAIMTLIMYASLYFPHGLVKEKVTVAITGALSGAVLLSSVNSQLGTVGYTMAVEYVFYIFFGLCLLCIVSVLAAERLRVAGHGAYAVRTEIGTRWLYLAAIIVTSAMAVVAASQWQAHRP